MTALGFERYTEPLRTFLNRYRDVFHFVSVHIVGESGSNNWWEERRFCVGRVFCNSSCSVDVNAFPTAAGDCLFPNFMSSNRTWCQEWEILLLSHCNMVMFAKNRTESKQPLTNPRTKWKSFDRCSLVNLIFMNYIVPIRHTVFLCPPCIHIRAHNLVDVALLRVSHFFPRASHDSDVVAIHSRSIQSECSLHLQLGIVAHIHVVGHRWATVGNVPTSLQLLHHSTRVFGNVAKHTNLHSTLTSLPYPRIVCWVHFMERQGVRGRNVLWLINCFPVFRMQTGQGL